MKHLTIVTLILCFSFSILKAETITKVVAKRDGNKVVITYNLQCNGSADISLYVSEKGDGTFIGPLKSVTGDVGNNIKPGSKVITLNTLEDHGIIVGNNTVFGVKVLTEFGKFTDSRDGKTYKTVKIGNQTIMAENLAYKASSGCWAFNNDESNVTKYGYLYDWETAKKVCPIGWHLPSKEEFETLLQDVGGAGKIAYKALIAKGNSGFSALLGGYRGGSGNGAFSGMDTIAYFWSSTPRISDRALARGYKLHLYSNETDAGIGNTVGLCGFSVRCIKD